MQYHNDLVKYKKNIPPEINIDAQILLEDAQKIVPGIKVGETIEEEVTPHDFGRVAASTAKQVLTQKIREAEKNSIIEEFADKQDEIMVGLLAMEDNKNYYIDLGRTRGILPKTSSISNKIPLYRSFISLIPSSLISTHYGKRNSETRASYRPDEVGNQRSISTRAVSKCSRRTQRCFRGITHRPFYRRQKPSNVQTADGDCRGIKSSNT